MRPDIDYDSHRVADSQVRHLHFGAQRSPAQQSLGGQALLPAALARPTPAPCGQEGGAAFSRSVPTGTSASSVTVH